MEWSGVEWSGWTRERKIGEKRRRANPLLPSPHARSGGEMRWSRIWVVSCCTLKKLLHIQIVPYT